MNYEETVDFLYHALPVFQHVGGEAYKPGIEQIKTLLDGLGNPHQQLCSVHVAGTNGKGSVSHIVASTLIAAGKRTGLFTSPHLVDFRERIKVDGAMVSKEYVVDFVEKHRAMINRLQPSFFELTTAMAFDYFAHMEVDVAVIEVGMGGRLDATNVIRPLVSIITNISLDHTQFLGDTLEKIALEKAGIIKEMTPVVVGESQIETKLTFIAAAKTCGAPICFADQMYRVVEHCTTKEGQQFCIESLLDGLQFTLTCDLLGGYQRKNILTALAALDLLNAHDGFDLSPEVVSRGVAKAAQTTGLRGRWQVIAQHPLTVCDTGHNVAGISEVVAQIKQQTTAKTYMVIGFVADKDIDGVLAILPTDAYYLFTQAAIARALPANELATRAAQYGLQGETVLTVAQALQRARAMASPDDLIFIGGSTFIAAETVD